MMMLSALGLLMSSDVISQFLTGFLMVAMVAGAIYVLGRRYFSFGAAVCAATFFYLIPEVYRFLVRSAKVDLGWAFFEVLALTALFAWREQREHPRWLVLAGVFSGLALGTKYIALINLLLIEVVV